MKAEEIRKHFSQADAVERLEVEKVAQLAEANEIAVAQNALLAGSMKLQVEMLKAQTESNDIQREMLELQKRMAEINMDPKRQGEHMFNAQMAAQECATNAGLIQRVGLVHGGRS
jgi:hypothetical protein